MSSEDKKLTDQPTPLFQSVLSVMKMAEKSGTYGLTKRAVVINVLVGAGLVKESEREHIGVIIDLIVYLVKNSGDLKRFAKALTVLV